MFSFGMIRINQAYIFRRVVNKTKEYSLTSAQETSIFLQSCRLDEGFKTK